MVALSEFSVIIAYGRAAISVGGIETPCAAALVAVTGELLAGRR